MKQSKALLGALLFALFFSARNAAAAHRDNSVSAQQLKGLAEMLGEAAGAKMDGRASAKSSAEPVAGRSAEAARGHLNPAMVSKTSSPWLGRQWAKGRREFAIGAGLGIFGGLMAAFPFVGIGFGMLGLAAISIGGEKESPNRRLVYAGLAMVALGAAAAFAPLGGPIVGGLVIAAGLFSLAKGIKKVFGL